MSVIGRLEAAGVRCYTRKEWGSHREADGSYARRVHTHPMPPGPASYHYLHITVTTDTDSVKEGAAGARQIETYGYSTPPMVSYQDLVTNEGKYYEGQNYRVKGTHTVNDKKIAGFPRDLNLYGYATALMQNVGDEVTDIQVRLVAMIFAARELEGLVRRGAPVYPHRKFANKGCPGDKAVARLDEIVRLKNRYVRNGLPRFGAPIISEEDDDVSAKEVWEWDGIPVIDGKKGQTQRAKWALSQARNRAGVAQDASRAAVEGIRDLAKLVGDPAISEKDKADLAEQIANRTASAIERLDAEAVAERLEITTKDEE